MGKTKETRGRSPRLGVSVNEKFYVAVQEEADRSGRTMSAIVRIAVEKYMREHGWDVEAKVEWGGWKGDASEGQQLDEAVA